MRYQNQLTENLLTLFDSYAEITGRGRVAASVRVARDRNFYSRLKKGANFTVGLYDNVVANFLAIWPKGHDWPSSVPAPDPSAANIQRTDEDT